MIDHDTTIPGHWGRIGIDLPSPPPIREQVRRWNVTIGAAITCGAVLIWAYVIGRALWWIFG
jgi:hypothetical protein